MKPAAVDLAKPSWPAFDSAIRYSKSSIPSRMWRTGRPYLESGRFAQCVVLDLGKLHGRGQMAHRFADTREIINRTPTGTSPKTPIPDATHLTDRMLPPWRAPTG